MFIILALGSNAETLASCFLKNLMLFPGTKWAKQIDKEADRQRLGQTDRQGGNQTKRRTDR